MQAQKKVTAMMLTGSRISLDQTEETINALFQIVS